MSTNAIYHPGSDTTYPFVRLDGLPDMPGQKVKAVEAPGVNGMAFKRRAYKANPVTLTTVTSFATSALAANTCHVSYKSLEGQQVKVWDSHSNSYSNCVVLGVRVVQIKACGGTIWLGQGANNTWRATVEWTVQYPYGSY